MSPVVNVSSLSGVVTISLATPTVPCSLERIGVAMDSVFDAWAWCESDVLEWRRPATSRQLDKSMTIDAQNPADLVFVFRDGADSTFLPRELARFHAKGYGLVDEWALAPYAIDDATDLLFERRVKPSTLFWVAAASLRALVWGLHDWAHFHNHGPFDEPALTELACDLVALSWLRTNRVRIGIDDTDLRRVALELAALSRTRFDAEGKKPPAGASDLDELFVSSLGS
ncbi:MAG: hypothetical protein JWO86_7078 [Myxococcaceae bacterium]|nr:hypothetical protein [Myxococcaceae bacterium]MEA2745861.1 hypothetical protein [Myxococcales bacterium]